MLWVAQVVGAFGAVCGGSWRDVSWGDAECSRGGRDLDHASISSTLKLEQFK